MSDAAAPKQPGVYSFDADTLVFLADALEVAAEVADKRDEETAIQSARKPKNLFATGALLREYVRQFRTDANTLEDR
jgi:hypothetical protein